MSDRVLLIDDDQATCEMLEITLRRAGLAVEWRTSAHDALELVAERDFDVVLTDLGMASLGGVELCGRILAIRPDMPVVVVTGNASFDAVAGSIRAALAASAEPVDVLVSDMNLPDGSGNDLLCQLRAHRALPAIAISGLDRDADVIRAREAGFDEYLGKPVSVDQLVAALRRVSGSAAEESR